MPSIANPLRIPGFARIAAGGWFIASGVTTLRRDDFLVPQAQRLFNGDMGKTDAPIRALLSLVLSIALIPIGAVLMAKGFAWLRRLPLPAAGPAPIDPAEVSATLVRREPPVFGDGLTAPAWPLRRLLADQLPDLTWWRRDLMGRGVLAFLRSCAFAILVGVLYLVVPYLIYFDLLGPFPTSFLLVLLFVTAMWAAFSLMLIPSDGPRIESFEFPVPPEGARGPVIETPPVRLERESPWLGVTLGLCGVVVQCLTTSWWKVSFLSYPHMATSIIRLAGSIGGGIAFLVVGERMQRVAAELLLVFRYASTLIFVAERGPARIGHAATVRTETRGLGGPRHVVSAAVNPQLRESVQRVVEVGA